jgi:hypothetical protein
MKFTAAMHAAMLDLTSRRQLCSVRERCWLSLYFHSLQPNYSHNKRRQKWIARGRYALNASGKPMTRQGPKWAWPLLTPPLQLKGMPSERMLITPASANRVCGDNSIFACHYYARHRNAQTGARW